MVVICNDRLELDPGGTTRNGVCVALGGGGGGGQINKIGT